MTIDKKEILYILDRLKKSKFRSGFNLNAEDIEYINKTGLKKIESHARGFVIKRLGPKFPKKDGRQTPFKGHPVFKAQHATASCCRDCLKKWHDIDKNKKLDEKEIEFITQLIMHWINTQHRFPSCS